MTDRPVPRTRARPNGSACQILLGSPFDAHLKSLRQAQGEAARLGPDTTAPQPGKAGRGSGAL